MAPDRRPRHGDLSTIAVRAGRERRSTDAGDAGPPAGYRGRRGPGRRRRRRAGRSRGRCAPGGRRARRHGGRAERGDRREAGPVRPRRARVRHRAQPADPAAGVPGPLRRDRRPPLEDAVDLVRLDPAVAYRFADGTRLDMPGDARARSPPRSTTPSAPAPARSGRRCTARAAACGGSARRPFLAQPAPRRRHPRRGSPATRRTSPPSRPGRPCAAWAPATCRIRGCGRCSTATPPTPAPTRAAPRRPGDGALRRAGVRRLVRPRRPPPARATRWPSGRRRAAPSSAPAAPCAGSWSRAAGPRGVELADGERLAADVVVSGADAAALYRDLLPRGPPDARGAAGPARGRRRRCPASSCCSPCAGRTPGLAHHTVLFPADYDAEFDARLRHRPFRGAPARAPTRRSTSAPRTTRRCGPTTMRVVVRAGQRPAARPGAAGSTGTRPAWPSATPTACSTCWRSAAWTSATASAGARSGRRPTSSGDTGSVGGSIYGTSSNGARAAFLRPANVSPVPGCSSSAVPRIPAAGCPGRPVGARSSPDSSGRPDGSVSCRCEAPPVRPDPPNAGPELQALTGFLDSQRQTILRRPTG